MRKPGSGRVRTQPVSNPPVIETWTPRLRVRLLALFSPALIVPLLAWWAATEPREVLLSVWLPAWVITLAFLGHLALLGLRARVVLRDDGVAIREAVRDRVATWDHLHSAAAHWGGLELRSYEPGSSDVDRYATSGIVVSDWRRPWRWQKRSQPVADRINAEISSRRALSAARRDGAPPTAGA